MLFLLLVVLRAAEGNLVSFALLRLLHCLLSKSNPVSVAAYTEIQALATCRHFKLQSFFNQYRNPICQVSVMMLSLFIMLCIYGVLLYMYQRQYQHKPSIIFKKA